MLELAVATARPYEIPPVIMEQARISETFMRQAYSYAEARDVPSR